MSYGMYSYPHGRLAPAQPPRCNTDERIFDTKELLKKQLDEQSKNDPNFRFNNLVNPATNTNPGDNVGFEDTEIYFDSTQRDTTGILANGELKWSIPQLNNNNDIRNCVEFNIGDFYFPKIYGAAGKPEYLYFKRVYLQIGTISSSQAVQAANNTLYHFEFDVENLNGQAVRLIPTKGSYFLQRPLTTLSEFQVIFTTPPTNSGPTSFRKIPLPRDTVTVQTVLNAGFGYNPIRFRVITGDLASQIVAPIGSTGIPGVAAYLSNYLSNDLAVNAAVNDPNGQYITNVLDDYTFEIAGINGTTVTSAYTATVYIPKNRIAFPVRFTSVRDTKTNFITVNHQ